MIYNEDCRETLKRKDLRYDYVFCVPPDFDELSLNPADTDHLNQYLNFLSSVFRYLEPKCNVVTIGITDRKFKGTVLSKHIAIISKMASLGYKLIGHKIWGKSYKRNLYRLNYSHIMSFGRGRYKQHHTPEYEIDIWNHKVYAHRGYPYAIALAVVVKCINNFTYEGDVVYDPFMGSGTTAIACLESKRSYIGSEISKKYCALAQDRISQYNNEPQMKL